MILAKSDGTTLEEHIKDCLVVWQELKKTLPKLPEITRLPEFWELLFAAVYIHDFGKAQKEFQNVLKGKPNNWCHQRHELYSVPFAEKFILPKSLQLILKQVVLGHHKDFPALYRDKYKKPEMLRFEKTMKWQKLKAHPEDYVYNLRTSFHQGLKDLINGFDTLAEHYRVGISFSGTVKFASQYHPYSDIASQERELDPSSMAYLLNMLLLGAVKICDHYGSAGVSRLSVLSDQHFSFLDKMKKDLVKQGYDFYEHQTRCAKTRDNCLLVAPTGSGKTEAALAWLRQQMQSQGRVFYILPFTASINAMHKRLWEKMDPDANDFSDIIGLQHGNVPSYLASLFTEDEKSNIHKRNAQIKTWRQQVARMQHPVKIVTPFQLLKYFYGVKGFEMGFTQLAGAKLIFDEIHAYEPATFAQIQVMLDYVIQNLDCNVIIMTATLPTFLKMILMETLQINQEVVAEKRFMTDFIRHEIHVEEGEIHSFLDQAVEDMYNGKRVIIACNTVKRAQDVYNSVLNEYGLSAEAITLLHGRFTAKDRQVKESQLFSKQTRLMIGTQAIEVSLDIDFDVMYTEPAPLDALLQRFGRVNRKGHHKEPCPIYIVRQGGEADRFIYSIELVQRSIKVLNDVTFLRETDVQLLLDQVYPDWLPEEKIKYEQTKSSFIQSLSSLQPYSYPKEREEEFYAKFDGILVLPARFWQDYKMRIEKYDFIGADQFLVSIHKGMYAQFREKSQIELRHLAIARDDGRLEKHTVLVAKCRYDSGRGMTNEREEMDDDPFI